MIANPGGIRPKFRIPRVRAGGVRRDRLFSQLEQAAKGPVTLVSAAAGSGKTFLVASWLLGDSARRAAWLRLDNEDREPFRLFRSLLGAIRAATETDMDFGHQTVALVEGPNSASLTTLIETFSADLHRLDKPVALVLDDYHEADCAAAGALLGRLVDALPTCVSLIVITRNSPELPLSVWQARAQVAVLTQADLAFSSDETSQFLRSTMELDLRPESTHYLHTRTEGWVAGLQLAALALRDREAGSDVDAAAGSISARNHFIRDYLSDDFISGLDARTIGFLESTCVLDSLCEALCNELTGHDDANEILRQLERRNVFIVPLDAERQWYRYHDLFREFLVDRIPLIVRSQLHVRAGNWFADHAQFDDAFRHLRASGKSSELIEFIRHRGEAIMSGPASGELLAWTAAIPLDQALQQPDMLGLRGWLLYLRGTEREAAPFARAALDCHQDPKMHTGLMFAFRAYCALRWSGPGSVEQLTTSALQRLEPTSHKLRSLMFSYRGQAQALEGRADAAISSYTDALQTGFALGKIGTLSGTLVHLVDLLLERGRSTEARCIVKEFIARIEDGSDGLLSSEGPPYIALAATLLASNELALAKDAAVRGLKGVDTAGLVYFRLMARTTLARILHAEGHHAPAWKLLDEARELSQLSGGHTRRTLVEATIAELRLQEGNTAMAAHALSQVVPLSEANPCDIGPVLQGRLLLAHKRSSEVLELLAPILVRAIQGGYVRTATEIRLIMARAYEIEGRRSEALAQLREALVEGAAGRFLRLFVNLAAGLSPALNAAAPAAPEFAQEVSAALDAGGSPQPEQTAGLTPKDVEVLSLISRGLQNKEIADSLNVTVGTAKQYVNRLFTKLGTRNRVEAISEGRRQHLIA